MPDDPTVRPLQDEPPQPRHHAPPRLAVGAAFLAIGGLLGWAAASIGGGETTTVDASEAQPGATATTIVPRDPRPSPTVTWHEASSVLAMPVGLEYNGSSGVVELGGELFFAINFRNPDTGAEHGEIWQSVDGLEWTSEEIDVGVPVVGLELTALGDTLLLAGSSGNDVGLWRSIPGRSIGGSSWTEVELDVPAELDQTFLATAVNNRAETMIVLIGELDIWREIVEPYVPATVDLADPKYILREDGVLFETWTEEGQDFAEVIPLFLERPEVVTTGGNVWIRFVTEDGGEGEEVLRTVPLPETAYPAEVNPSLASIPIVMAWVSSDGDTFLPVIGRNALPDGFFLPEPWGDSFVTAVYELEDSFAGNEQVRLWTSGSGRAWQESPDQPPAECSPFFIAVSANSIHLTGQDRTQCVRTLESGWEVLTEPSTAAYVVGGVGGFVGYPDEFEYDTATFSRDGINWTEIEIPGTEPYPTLEVLRDRLVAISVNRPRPNQPTQIDIWQGTITH